MKEINKLSKKFAEYCELSGIDINKVRENMDHVFVYRLTQSEAKQEGCDLNYPYKIDNPYNFNLRINY